MLYNSMQFAYRYTWNREIIVNSQKLVKRRWLSKICHHCMRKVHASSSYLYELPQVTEGTIIGIVDLFQNYTRHAILQIQQSPSPSTRKTPSHARLLWPVYVTVVGFSSPTHFTSPLLTSHFASYFRFDT